MGACDAIQGAGVVMKTSGGAMAGAGLTTKDTMQPEGLPVRSEGQRPSAAHATNIKPGGLVLSTMATFA